MGEDSPDNVLRLPGEGCLLVCTDLHGNLADFRKMVERFLAAREEVSPCHLLFTGDLIHGPCYERDEWPEYLGSFYEDRSGQLVDEFIALQGRFPGEVHCLLGNHEHSHVGGPHTPKFWDDETAHFERMVGQQRTRSYKQLFCSFHVVALTRCGIVVTHAAPNVELGSIEEIEQLRFDGHNRMSLTSIYSMPLLGRLLWSRRCPEAVARKFLAAVSEEDRQARIVVFGHDIVPEGYVCFGGEQLMLSTSFGLEDGDKIYMRLDLGATYQTTEDFAEDRELLPLYDR